MDMKYNIQIIQFWKDNMNENRTTHSPSCGKKRRVHHKKRRGECIIIVPRYNTRDYSVPTAIFKILFYTSTIVPQFFDTQMSHNTHLTFGENAKPKYNKAIKKKKGWDEQLSSPLDQGTN